MIVMIYIRIIYLDEIRIGIINKYIWWDFYVVLRCLNKCLIWIKVYLYFLFKKVLNGEKVINRGFSNGRVVNNLCY